MTILRRSSPFASLVLLGLLTSGAHAASWQAVMTGRHFEQPVAMAHPPGSGVWYVVEKGGRIWRQQGKGFVLFADLSARVDASAGESGLLGLAFHPDYANNHRIFLSYTVRSRPLRSIIAEYRERDGRLSTRPVRRLLQVEQPYRNHNSGQLAFGPDGYLYISLGDGGAGGDPHGNGQNPDTLLGSLLRIDVDHGMPYAIPADNPFARGGGRPEVYAYGLRNPWGWGFDRDTGRLWLADVGQDRWEEIDVIQAGGNYGWNRREGRHCYAKSPCKGKGLIEPVAEYSHQQGCSVVGGRVYRGKRVPALRGQYLFTDFCSGRIWALDAERGGRPDQIGTMAVQPVGFAEGPEGDLYLISLRGGIYRLED